MSAAGENSGSNNNNIGAVGDSSESPAAPPPDAPLAARPAESNESSLLAFAQSPPSKFLLLRLAEHPVTTMFAQQPSSANAVAAAIDPNLVSAYLQAVARHLPAEHTAAETAAAGFVDCSQHVAAILAAVGNAVTKCPPHMISQSGILSVLAVFHHQAAAGVLTAAHVEFLQVAVHALQYRYADRILADTWPRPTSDVTVHHVLRYFFLRGVVHLHRSSSNSSFDNSNHWDKAIRCFWTVLSIPADIMSPVALAAWKKLVLVQCLACTNQLWVHIDENHVENHRPPLSLPQAAPTCVSRLVSAVMGSVGKTGAEAATVPSSSMSTASTTSSQQAAGAPEMFMVPPEVAGAPTGAVGWEQQPRRSDNISMSNGMRVYVQLARAFLAVDRAAFGRLLHEHATTVLQPDGNFELVRDACQAALVRRHLFQLASIYYRLPLSKLVQLLQLPDAAAVQQLIMQVSVETAWAVDIIPAASGEGEEEAFVVFPPRPSLSSSPEAIEQQQQQIIKLTHLIRNLDVSIAASTKYASLQRKADKNSSKAFLSGPRGVEDI